MFCQNCGVQLAPVASAPPPPPVQVAPAVTPSLAPAGPAPVSGPPGAQTVLCPTCGYANIPGDMFCQNCGAQFEVALERPAPLQVEAAPASQPEPEKPAAESIPPPQDLKQVDGKFVVRTTRAEIEFPVGKTELTIGRSDPVRGIYPDIDLTTYGGETGGVSRIHARLTLQDNQIFLEDLNSTNFTFLNRQKLEPGQRYLLNSGDAVRLGLLLLEYVHII